MNRVILLGRLTKESEINEYGETTVLKNSIAVDRGIKDKEGNKITDFINITAFGKNAVNIDNFFSKGNLIAVEGRLQIENYTDKDGNKRQSHTVVVDRFDFCGEKKKEADLDLSNIPDDDLPF